MTHIKTGKLTKSDKRFLATLDEDELQETRAAALQALGIAALGNLPPARRLKQVIDEIDGIIIDRELKKSSRKKPKKGRRK